MNASLSEMLSNIFLKRNPVGSVILEERDIISFRSHLELFFFKQQQWAPRKSRQECLDKVRSSLREGSRTELVRSALDLATHALFGTDQSAERQGFANGCASNLLKTKDFEHWDQLHAILSEEYGEKVEELMLLLVIGPLVEGDCILSREVDELIGPYRATQDIEAWIRYNVARKSRGFDIEALENLGAQYNNTGGTPIHELVELGLSNVINLRCNEDICYEYERIFVNRSFVSAAAVQGVPIFALSYKHESRDLWMSKESFLEVCSTLKRQGFGKVQLWVDAVLKESPDPWARRGLLPYTVLPVVIHNNELYDKGSERIWLKLERVASSGRSGVLYTRPTKYNNVHMKNCVTGDTRDLVAGCILLQDYDPDSVKYAEDAKDLKGWAMEHLTVATFRAYLGISILGSGRVSEVMKQECLYSAALNYNETMPHREVQYLKHHPWFPDMNCEHQEIRSISFARNERLMRFLFTYNENVYMVRVNHGLGITVLRMDVVKNLQGHNHTERFYRTSGDERQRILRAVTHEIVHLSEKRQDYLWDSIIGLRTGLRFILAFAVYVVRKTWQFCFGETFREGVQTGNSLVRFDAWDEWPGIFSVKEAGMRNGM